jgi:tRNA (Thr-GGU) A37 N-methylase
LIVENVDMLDGSPLIDIKPYNPEFDNADEVQIGWLDKPLSKKTIRIVADNRFGEDKE